MTLTNTKNGKTAYNLIIRVTVVNIKFSLQRVTEYPSLLEFWKHYNFYIITDFNDERSDKQNGVLWDVTPCASCRNPRFGGTTEPSRLMICKIWGFHDGDYEECPLLGYKNTVRTSQETHYVSATEPSRLMLCKMWGVHGGDYEECRPLECYGEWPL
jgi:hypothetical protein